VVCATPQTVPHDKQGSEYARGNSRLQKIFPARLNEIKKYYIHARLRISKRGS
jgi:hypothetical protein